MKRLLPLYYPIIGNQKVRRELAKNVGTYPPGYQQLKSFCTMPFVQLLQTVRPRRSAIEYCSRMWSVSNLTNYGRRLSSRVVKGTENIL